MLAEEIRLHAVWTPSGGPYICRLFLCPGFYGQRFILSIVNAVIVFVSVVYVVDQPGLFPNQRYKAIFATLVQSLNGPKEIIDDLQADYLLRVRRLNLDRRGRRNVPFRSQVLASSFQCLCQGFGAVGTAARRGPTCAGPSEAVSAPRPCSRRSG